MAASEVDVGRCEIVEALVVSAMIVMLNESRDLGFEVFQEEVVFQQDAVLQRLVPPFDLARKPASGSASFWRAIAFRRGASSNPSNRQRANPTALWPWLST